MIHTCANTATTIDGRVVPSCAACVEQYRRENTGRCAAVVPQPMTWTCERCKRVVYVGNETHLCETTASPSIEDLLARSSLGTPEAVALRRSAPRAAVEDVLRRVAEEDRKTKS